MILMRDKRAIIIKSPRLQKIRNNLRLLLLKAARTERERLYKEWRGFLVGSEGKRHSIKEFSQDKLEQFRNLQEQEEILKSISDRSICKCIACGKADRDMVYNKAYDAWYCTDCYGLERSVAQRRTKTRERGSKSCEEKALEEHSKTFL